MDGYDFLHRRGTLLLNGRIGHLSLVGLAGRTSLLGSMNFEGAYFLSDRFAVEGQFLYSGGSLELGTSEIPTGHRP